MTNLATIQAEIMPEQTEVEAALDRLRALVISDDGILNWAAEMLKHAKGRARDLNERRKEVTGPILAAKAAIDGLFNPLIERYGQAEAILKSKIAEHTNAVEAQRRAVMTASAAEHAAGGTPTAIVPEPVQVQGVSVRKVWDFEVTDPAQVPRDFCTPDPGKLRAWMKLGGDSPATIPGVRFFQRDQVAARVGK